MLLYIQQDHMRHTVVEAVVGTVVEQAIIVLTVTGHFKQVEMEGQVTLVMY